MPCSHFLQLQSCLMTAFQTDMLLLFKYILAAGLSQSSNISSSPTDSARGGKKMWLLRSRIWIQSWLSCWRGAPGGSSTARGESGFVHCFGGTAPVGFEWGGLGFKTFLWPWGERNELWDSFYRLSVHLVLFVWVRSHSSTRGWSQMCVCCSRGPWDL